MPQPVLGQVYDPSLFSSINYTFHPFIIFDIDSNGLPFVTVQPQYSSTIVRHAIISGANPSTVYFTTEPNGFKVLTYSNAAAVAIYYMTQAYCSYMYTKNCNIYNTQVSLSNGTFQTIFVCRKANTSENQFICQYLWASQSSTFTQPDVSNVQSYLSSIPSYYDVRLLTDVDITWCDSLIQSLAPVETIALVGGSRYAKTLFSDINTPDIENIYLTVNPSTVFSVSNTAIKNATIQGKSVYILDDNDSTTYLYLNTVVPNSTAVVYIDSNAKTLLTEKCSMLMQLQSGRYLFVCRSPLVDVTKHFCINILSSVMHSDIDNTHLDAYVNGIAEYDVRILEPSNIAWYTEVFKTGLYDAVTTSILIPPTIPVVAPVVISDPNVSGMNLIYAKSLYESTSEYISNVTARLTAELNEEIILNNKLQTDINDSVVFNEISAFIINSNVDVTTKLNTLMNLQSQLMTYIAQNKALLTSNTNLHNLLQSQAAVSLTSNILKLRDIIYDSIKYLVDNNRYGANNDIVYLISRTKL